LIANLTLVSYPVAGGLNLSASVYNIFDNEHVRLYDFLPLATSSQVSVENGREFRLQMGWQF
jgi:outer membrane receptor protein involved in Fe transport